MTPFEFLIIEGQNLANQLPCPPLPSPSRNESTGIGFEVAAFIMIDAASLPSPSRNESTGIGFEVAAFIMIDATLSLFL